MTVHHGKPGTCSQRGAGSTIERSVLPLLLLCLFSSAVCGCTEMEEPRATFMNVKLVGKQYEWHLKLPGLDGILGTSDDVTAKNNLVLPEHTCIRLTLSSADYIYVFRLPHLDISQIAVPDLDFTLTFDTDAHDVLSIKGDQLCGFQHESLEILIRVQSWSRFRHWLREAMPESE